MSPTLRQFAIEMAALLVGFVLLSFLLLGCETVTPTEGALLGQQVATLSAELAELQSDPEGTDTERVIAAALGVLNIVQGVMLRRESQRRKAAEIRGPTDAP